MELCWNILFFNGFAANGTDYAIDCHQVITAVENGSCQQRPF